MTLHLMLIAILWLIIVFTFLKLWSKYLASVDGVTTKNSQVNQNNVSSRKGEESINDKRKTNRLYK